MIKNIKKNNQGFTLVELLVVIGIIAILFSVVLIAIDPAKRLKQTRDATRKQDVAHILEAVQEYIVDNSGSYPSSLSSSNSIYMMGTGNSSQCPSTTCAGYTTIAGCLDLGTNVSNLLVPQYLSSMPQDPSNGTASSTRYAIQKTTAGRVLVISCDAEISAISVQR